MSMPKITTASAKVMRSFDYCHFEIALGLTHETEITNGEIDDLRKDAARLADKAVEQYKIAKANFESIDTERLNFEYDERRLKAIREKPEHERTPDQQAALKAHNDFQYRARYDYQDDWQDA